MGIWSGLSVNLHHSGASNERFLYMDTKSKIVISSLVGFYNNKDVTLFAQWHAETSLLETNVAAKSMSGPKETSAKCDLLADTTDKAMMTYPADKNFVAYDGDESPWD